jgi:hypothetical protein
MLLPFDYFLRRNMSAVKQVCHNQRVLKTESHPKKENPGAALEVTVHSASNLSPYPVSDSRF